MRRDGRGIFEAAGGVYEEIVGLEGAGSLCLKGISKKRRKTVDKTSLLVYSMDIQ